MHIRAVHAELSPPKLHAFIRENPLGLITTAISHPGHALIQTSHVPFVLAVPPTSASADSDGGISPGKAVLRGHMARANPQVKAMIHSVTSSSSDLAGTEMEGDGDILCGEVLVLFQAPVHAYVTPRFYTHTKPSTGKVVPTWDYAAVQVYGRLRLYHSTASPTTSTYLSTQIHDLSVQQERLANPTSPWQVDEAPEKYVDYLKKAIVGVEITVDRCEGRFKLSQEMTDGDWEGVVDGFLGVGTEEGRVMAGMVRREGEGKRRGEVAPPARAGTP